MKFPSLFIVPSYSETSYFHVFPSYPIIFSIWKSITFKIPYDIHIWRWIPDGYSPSLDINPIKWFCWSLSLLNGYFIGNINPTFSGSNPCDLKIPLIGEPKKSSISDPKIRTWSSSGGLSGPTFGDRAEPGRRGFFHDLTMDFIIEWRPKMAKQ